MVFKGRFFSKKSSDSSDGSNSPRRFNSPSRSEKKKGRAAEKEESNFTSTPSKLTASTSNFKKKESKGKEAQVETTMKPNSTATSASVSPILASSLGLNKIKTRSGPLPQESYLGFRADKAGLVIGSSNLSRNNGSGREGSGSRGKKEMGGLEKVAESGSNSETMSPESGGRGSAPSPNLANAGQLPRSRLSDGGGIALGCGDFVGFWND